MTTRIGPLDKAEIKTAIFSFSNEISGATIATASVAAELVTGTDASPGTLLNGGVTIDNTSLLVSQNVAGATGRVGNTYRLRCVATSSAGTVHTVAALLDVVSL